ncbi:hypothetical protein LBMAG53_02690 [Planctomycetota bacterium]|nr:hypothetical protein LBMAG53_02690 [Planctomycetota bacterium]
MPVGAPVNRQVVAENRIFATVAEEIRDRHGQPYTYHQVEARSDAVVAVPVLADGRLLVERIYRHPYKRWFHEFPGGGIDPGEDPVAAAARELLEETGHAGAAPRLLQALEVMPGLLRMRLHVVLIEGCRRVAEPQLEAMELLEVEALTRDQAWTIARSEPPSSFLVLGLWAWQG